MLQTEENRIMKKIENTRKRADQILEIKKTNESRYNSLIQSEEQRDEMIREKQLAMLHDRKQRKHLSEVRVRTRLDQLKSNYSTIKDNRGTIDETKK